MLGKCIHFVSLHHQNEAIKRDGGFVFKNRGKRDNCQPCPWLNVMGVALVQVARFCQFVVVICRLNTKTKTFIRSFSASSRLENIQLVKAASLNSLAPKVRVI